MRLSLLLLPLLCSELILGEAVALPGGFNGQSNIHKIQDLSIEELEAKGLDDLDIDKLRKRIVRERISARSFRAIEAAIPELERKGLRVDDYQIVVSRRGNLLFVLFTNRDEDGIPGHTGCMGPHLCFFVELNVDNLRVIRSDFSR
jgi:hypothetical protein